MPLHFLHPEYFWFLLFLLIPIIIHLFKFKPYKKIYFSNVQLLKNLNTEYKKKSKLKKLLLLLLRLLALSCLVIAFTQPYLPSENNSIKEAGSDKNLIIYIDNSFSMNGNSEKGIALEVAKNEAIGLVKSVPDHTKIKIYSNDINHILNPLTKNQAIARIQEIAPSPLRVKLSGKIQNILIDSKQKHTKGFIFSDFQKNQSDFDKISADSAIHLSFVPIEIQSSNNLVLDTCWFQTTNYRANSNQSLYVRVKNNSSQRMDGIPIELTINDQIKSIASVDVEPNSYQVAELRFNHQNNRFCKGKISIEDFPIVYDNQLYFSYQINEQSKILAVNQDENNKYLNNLFQTTDRYQFTNCSKSQIYNYSLSEYELIILNEISEIESGFNQLLQTYMQNGGTVLFVPGKTMNTSLNSFLKDISANQYLDLDTTTQKIAKIELNAELYNKAFEKIEKDARLPDVYKHYLLSKSSNSLSENLWQTAGGRELFNRTPLGNGNFYQLAMNFNKEWTNLMTHPVFIPSILNLGNSSDPLRPLYFETGKNTAIKILKTNSFINDIQFHLINHELRSDVILQKLMHPAKGQVLYTHDQIRHAGNYDVVANDSVLQVSSFNYSRDESSDNFYSFNDIQAKIKTLGLNFSSFSLQKMKLSELYNEQRKGRQMWKIFILFSCLLFIAEGLMQNPKTKN